VTSGSTPSFDSRGVPSWSFARGAWRLRFYGRGAPQRAEGLAPARPRAWAEQVHGNVVLEARAGACGRGDALLLDASAAVAGCIATADCVPVALVAPARAALVHAGWRGVAGGVVARALERLADAGEVAAFLGPAIGPCCYEVGDEVAEAVVAAADASVLEPGVAEGGRAHLALHRAISIQLRRAGVAVTERVGHCTRCRPEWLASHRRDAERAGRNWALLWREG
jgi:YfiH family protein